MNASHFNLRELNTRKMTQQEKLGQCVHINLKQLCFKNCVVWKFGQAEAPNLRLKQLNFQYFTCFFSFSIVNSGKIVVTYFTSDVDNNSEVQISNLSRNDQVILNA